MTTTEFVDFMNSGKQVTAECGVHQTMRKLSQEAIRITMEINNHYHTPDEINTLMSELIGEPVEVGHIDDTSALADILGTGNITVDFN